MDNRGIRSLMGVALVVMVAAFGLFGFFAATAQQQADWAETSASEPSYVANKPHIAPNASLESLQADWLESDRDELGYIQNKPTLIDHTTTTRDLQANWQEEDDEAIDYIQGKPVALAQVPDDARVEDLLADWTNVEMDSWGYIKGKPEIPANATLADLQADWAEDDSTALGYIQNKPLRFGSIFKGTYSSSADPQPTLHLNAGDIVEVDNQFYISLDPAQVTPATIKTATQFFHRLDASGSGGLTTAGVQSAIRGYVYGWALNGNTQLIPSSKLPVVFDIATWAREGDTDLIPAAKIPTNDLSSRVIFTTFPPTANYPDNFLIYVNHDLYELHHTNTDHTVEGTIGELTIGTRLWKGMVNQYHPEGYMVTGRFTANHDSIIGRVIANAAGDVELTIERGAYRTAKGSNEANGDTIQVTLSSELGNSTVQDSVEMTLIDSESYVRDSIHYIRFAGDLSSRRSPENQSVLWRQPVGRAASVRLTVSGNDIVPQEQGYKSWVKYPLNDVLDNALAIESRAENADLIEVIPNSAASLPPAEDYAPLKLVLWRGEFYHQGEYEEEGANLSATFHVGRYSGTHRSLFGVQTNFFGQWIVNPDLNFWALTRGSDGGASLYIKASAYETAKGSAVADGDQISVQLTTDEASPGSGTFPFHYINDPANSGGVVYHHFQNTTDGVFSSVLDAGAIDSTATMALSRNSQPFMRLGATHATWVPVDLADTLLNAQAIDALKRNADESPSVIEVVPDGDDLPALDSRDNDKILLHQGVLYRKGHATNQISFAYTSSSYSFFGQPADYGFEVGIFGSVIVNTDNAVAGLFRAGNNIQFYIDENTIQAIKGGVGAPVSLDANDQITAKFTTDEDTPRTGTILLTNDSLKVGNNVSFSAHNAAGYPFDAAAVGHRVNVVLEYKGIDILLTPTQGHAAWVPYYIALPPATGEFIDDLHDKTAAISFDDSRQWTAITSATAGRFIVVNDGSNLASYRNLDFNGGHGETVFTVNAPFANTGLLWIIPNDINWSDYRIKVTVQGTGGIIYLRGLRPAPTSVTSTLQNVPNDHTVLMTSHSNTSAYAFISSLPRGSSLLIETLTPRHTPVWTGEIDPSVLDTDLASALLEVLEDQLLAERIHALGDNASNQVVLRVYDDYTKAEPRDVDINLRTIGIGPNIDRTIEGLAWSRSTGQAYYVDRLVGSTAVWLNRFDPVTGVATRVGSATTYGRADVSDPRLMGAFEPRGIAIADDGKAYLLIWSTVASPSSGAERQGWSSIYELNLETGVIVDGQRYTSRQASHSSTGGAINSIAVADDVGRNDGDIIYFTNRYFLYHISRQINQTTWTRDHSSARAINSSTDIVSLAYSSYWHRLVALGSDGSLYEWDNSSQFDLIDTPTPVFDGNVTNYVIAFGHPDNLLGRLIKDLIANI